MTYAMGGAHLRTPQSIFEHMMGQQNTHQQRIGDWMQLPQVPPISIPWSIPSFQQPELTRFTGESSGPILHQKRKLDTVDLPDTHQTKQFISEEKMAARFKELHISSSHGSKTSEPSTSTTNTASCSRKSLDMDLDLINTEDTIKMEANGIHPRLILSEELKRIQQEPILPSSLLSQLERPSMALVLWEPPTKHLRILPTRDTPTPIPSISDDNNNNNNSDVIPDLNHLLHDSISSAFEPMEL